MTNSRLPRAIFCVAVTAACFAARPPAARAAVDFNRDVRPILSENCFACHGPDERKRKAGMRLDLREAALKEAESGAVPIVPGKPDESELLKRITSGDPDEKMPPAKSKKQLTADQIETLRKWIAEGAKYQGHWAFTAPARPDLPPVKDEPWARNAIDRFVLARLENEHLKPSPEADRAALLRRLSLDLIGLPPSPREIDEFLKDTSEGAYEKQINRLMASEHFGEKWARHWMDVARYADSDGYEKDLPRNQWVWRDWVIRALNADMPYDRFVIEQLAGDLLPGATQDTRIATGFLRNGMVNEEGAIIAEQFRMEGMFDRMDAIGKGILGLTLQCAQCHSHKYDPLKHDEYYRLMAFVNNDYEAITWVYSQPQLEQIGKIRSGIEALEAKLKADHPDWQQKLAAWEEDAKKPLPAWENLSPSEHEWVGGLAHPQKLKDDSILTLGFRPSDGELYCIAETKLTNVTGLRLEALTHGDLPFNGPGRSQKGTFAVSEVVVEAMPLGAKDGAKDAKWKKLKFSGATADFEEPERQIPEPFRKAADDKRRIGPAGFLVDGKNETAWGADRGAGRRHQDSTAVLRFAEPVGFPEGTKLKVTLQFRHSGKDDHGRKNNFLGRFRLGLTTAPEPKADPLPKAVRDALRLAPEKRSDAQTGLVFSHWRSTVAEFQSVNDEAAKLWSQYPEGETVLNLVQRPPEDPRQTFLMDRGSWEKPTKPLTAGVPAFLHSLPEGAGSDRLALAKWLVDRRSPTTARVAVNRVWQTLFGVGLVDTPEDFGVRASDPSHPDLLDWLAVEFMDRGWSHKALLRTIVTSATYRQSATIPPALLERDPQNRLLARGPRFRAEAEVVRDVALAASGLINERVGGPSFFPPVPDGFLSLSFLEIDFWNVAPPPERYRRSLYVFRRRSMPDPLLSTFDAPNGDFACARRARSNTPLAALAGMNEPVFVEAARAMAIRVLRESGKSDAERAAYAFRLCTSRVPTQAEVEEILRLYQAARARIAEGWLAPKEVATGDVAKMPELPHGASPAEPAAWTVVSRVLLNLDETVTKN